MADPRAELAEVLPQLAELATATSRAVFLGRPTAEVRCAADGLLGRVADCGANVVGSGRAAAQVLHGRHQPVMQPSAGGTPRHPDTEDASGPVPDLAAGDANRAALDWVVGYFEFSFLSWLHLG